MNFSKFKNPETILRPAPFWSINGEITPEETARQMSDMMDKGMSGGFFHARSGLATEYMGKEWFASLRAVLEVARKRDGYLWLYDEDRFPSGYAGGKVAALGEEYQQAYLEAEYVPRGSRPSKVEGKEVASYIIEGRKGVCAVSARIVSFKEAEANTNSERMILRTGITETTGWHNGYPYVNLLNPKVTKEFIKHTHAKYAKELSGEMGRRIPGIFTDEPHIRVKKPDENNGTLYAVPWWDGFFKLYKEKYGRELKNDLPFLFLNGPEHRLIRQKFHRMLNRQFAEAFSKQIYDWCEKNKIEFTGHYYGEEDFYSQILFIGGPVMTHYKYMQAPGIDHLMRKTDGKELVVKQVVSGARQLGRKRIMSEIFGGANHSVTFEYFKRLADYDLAAGINFFVPHLTWYTMKGAGKRDWPQNIHYQQESWKYQRPLNDYMTRLCAIMFNGKPQVDMVVLSPIEEAMAEFRRSFISSTQNVPAGASDDGINKAVHETDDNFNMIVKAIMDAGYDFDIGDEGYLEDIGCVKAKKFIIGEMAYGTVVVPPAKSWSTKTYYLLKTFAEHGGSLIFCGIIPSEIDCEPAAEKWRQLAAISSVKVMPISPREIQDCVDHLSGQSFSLRDAFGRTVKNVVAQHRKINGSNFFFAANVSLESSQRMRLTIKNSAETKTAVWDALLGKRYKAKTRQQGKDLVYEFNLDPAGSILFVTGKAAEGAEKAPANSDFSHGKVERFPDIWEYSLSEPNVLVLDKLSYSLDGGTTFSKEMYEDKARIKIKEHFDLMGAGDYLEIQPWLARTDSRYRDKGGEVIQKFKVIQTTPLKGKTWFIAEDIQRGSLKVNGRDVSTATEEWHWDRGFGKVDISQLLVKGENEILFTMKADVLHMIEPAYIIGDFGVAMKDSFTPTLVEKKKNIISGSLINQGFPFYPGTFVYKTIKSINPAKDAKYAIRLLNPAGVLFVIKINGREAGRIMWGPRELDVTRHIKKGENRIEIEVIGSQYNAHGPNHWSRGDSTPHGPWQFDGNTEAYILLDTGLLEGAEFITLS